MRETFVVQLTIEKSAWLQEDALVRLIEKQLEWHLATAGCRIVKADMVNCTKETMNTGEKILASDNIWTAIEILTNDVLGMKAGQHLETLLCKELGKPQYLLVDSDGNYVPEKETPEENNE